MTFPAAHAVLVCAALFPAADAGGDSGVVLTAVEPGHAAERAGLRSGDVLIAYAASDGGGGIEALNHPFDLPRAEAVAAGSPVRMQLQRGATQLESVLPVDRWGIEARPPLDEAAAQGHRRGLAHVAAGEFAAAYDLWSRAAGELRGSAPRTAAWFWTLAGEAAVQGDRAAEARAAFDAARRLVAAEDTFAVSAAEARAWAAANQIAAARATWQAWLAAPERTAGLLEASAHQALGELAYRQRDVADATRHYEQALALRERLAGGSPASAETLQGLGYAAIERRDLEAAAQFLAASAAITAGAASQTLLHAQTLRAQGIVAAIRSDPREAAEYWRQTLAIQQSLAPDGTVIARTRSNLGIAAWQQGDLAQAEAHFHAALQTIEQTGPGSVEHAGYLNNLGLVHHNRFEFAKARVAYSRAAEIFRAIAPGSLELARALTNVALAEGLGGEPRAALSHLEQVLTIQRQHDPQSTDVAQTYHAMGLNLQRLGELEQAEAQLRRALELRRALVPGGLNIATTAQSLGEVLRARGELDDAERHFEFARELVSQLAPDSTQEAEAHHGLASVHRLRGETEQALQDYAAAIEALESQSHRLGGSDEARAGFLQRFAHYYKDYIELLLEQQSHPAAFDVLERYRAQALLALLAERPLQLERRLPAELEAERAELDQSYERAQAALRQLSDTPDNSAAIQARQTQLAQLRERRAELADRIRATAPRVGELEYSQPLRWPEARGRLAPGTLLLSYCLTETRAYLFALEAASGAEPQVFALASDAASLRRDVERLRLLIRAPRAGPDSRAALDQLSSELYQVLIEPVAERLAAAERLLIIPDGALHMLPFAALRAADAGGYLGQRLPVQVAVSATVYAELAGRRPAGAAVRPAVVAFGDVRYESAPLERPGDDAERGAYSALPYSRDEVEAIGAVFGAGAELFLGEAASEENAKSLPPGVRYVHFASHGVLDERFPLDSLLALSPSGDRDNPGQNGLLQAWEIFEQLHLDAELVVLSACETALGREVGGEGLIGLTRAFHYAGARNVLASLWAVPDRSTALLMDEFYRGLAAGLPQQEALREAQGRLIDGTYRRSLRERLASWFGAAGGGFSHPYYWAAFQLNGAAL